jgi:hypothetical protein
MTASPPRPTKLAILVSVIVTMACADVLVAQEKQPKGDEALVTKRTLSQQFGVAPAPPSPGAAPALRSLMARHKGKIVDRCKDLGCPI